jgi:hypothetical protein
MKIILIILNISVHIYFFHYPSGNKCHYISPQRERIKTRSLILADSAAEIDPKV